MRLEDAITIIDCKDHYVATLNASAAVRKGEGTKDEAIRKLAEMIREMAACH